MIEFSSRQPELRSFDCRVNDYSASYFTILKVIFKNQEKMVTMTVSREGTEHKIRVTPTAMPSVIQYSKIEFGTDGINAVRIDIEIINNILIKHKSEGTNLQYCAFSFNNNTVVDNYRGIDIEQRYQSEMINNIFYDNSYARDGGASNTSYNNYWKCSHTYSLFEGEIEVNPQFIAPNKGDFHLNPSSPCMTTGKHGTQMGVYGP